MKILKILLLLTLISAIHLKSWSQTKEICYQAGVPYGWAITDARLCKDCCGTTNDLQLGVKWTIEKIATQPVGTLIWVCPNTAKRTKYQIPEGWSVIEVEECNKCCGYEEDLVIIQKWLIERLH